jgi:hypothetical protein
MRLIMKRSVLAAIALALSALAVVPAIAGDFELRTTAGKQKFWKYLADQQGH